MNTVAFVGGNKDDGFVSHLNLAWDELNEGLLRQSVSAPARLEKDFRCPLLVYWL